MFRRTYVPPVGVALLLTTLVTFQTAVVAEPGSSSPSTTLSVEPPGERPNIVLITTDDQSLAEMKWLPKTRRLIGGSGVTFDQMLSPHPLCCPARAQILTGQYAQNNGVRTNRPPWGYDQFQSETAMPVWIQNAGYQTGFVGKFLNGYQEAHGVEPGWDHWDPSVGNIYDYYGVDQYTDGTPDPQPESAYHTDTVTDRTNAMIEEFSTGEEPFFVWSSYVAPHGTCFQSQETNCSAPPRPAEKYAGKYPNARAPFLDTPSFNEADISDKPRSVKRYFELVDRGEMKRLFTQRIRALASVDDGVASTLETLRATGELDNTVVVFTSDNGYMFGEHRFTGKVLGYEESVRVPLLMRGPGIPAGERRNQTVALIDLAPTFAALAEARPLVPVDGQTILPYARNDGRQFDRTVLLLAGTNAPNRDENTAWNYRGVRTDRYTLIRWQRRDVETELYDRRADPYQLENIRGQRRYTEVRRELQQRLRKLQDCSGDSCRTGFGVMPRPARG